MFKLIVLAAVCAVAAAAPGLIASPLGLGLNAPIIAPGIGAGIAAPIGIGIASPLGLGLAAPGLGLATSGLGWGAPGLGLAAPGLGWATPSLGLASPIIAARSSIISPVAGLPISTGLGLSSPWISSPLLIKKA